MATKKTARPTRRASGKAAEVPMYLDTDVHVMRDEKLVVVRGGVLLDDTDLEEEEIEEIKRHGVIRHATSKEIERLAQADASAEYAELQATQTAEMQSLVASHDVELEGAKRDGKPAEAIAKLQEKHGTAVSKLHASHAAALNTLAE